MATFLLIRHGHHDLLGKTLVGWMPGVHISAQGREQAEHLAARLARAHNIEAIVSSPLERAMETAEPLARLLGLTVETSEAVGEVRIGSWTGKHFEGLKGDRHWHNYNRNRSGTRPPEGELAVEVQARFVMEMERLRAARPEGTVAIVSHADPIRAALAHYAGIAIDLAHRFEISPASASALEIHDWGVRILYLNLPAAIV